MMTSAPAVVDVITPVYNQAELVSETIRSLQQQTFPHWQLIAVDDASKDRTLDVLHNASENDERINVRSVSEGPRGACHARNLGFRAGNSPYVMFLDSDDLLSETCIETRLASLQGNSELDFVLGNTALFDRRPYDLGILWNTPSLDVEIDLLRFLRQDMPWHTMTPLWRRISFSRLGGWNENLAAFQDWELHIRACHLQMRYKLAGCKPDCFYRRPNQARISIASSHLSPKNTAARLLAIQAVANLDKFRNSRERREHVEAFCLRNALQFLDSGKQTEAAKFLWGCFKGGLFSPVHTLGAIAILLRGPSWRGSRLARALKARFWSAESRVDPWDKVKCSV